jgi:hypothetical protein
MEIGPLIPLSEYVEERLALPPAVPERETINKLYLELSQVATAKTARELELEDLLTSARAIAERCGVDTAWERFSKRLADAGIGSVTAKVFKVLPSDSE